MTSMTAETEGMTTEFPKDFITVNETAKRTFRSIREVIRLLCAGKIKGKKLGEHRKSQWIVFWPSVVEYYTKRGIEFPSPSTA